MSCMRKRISYIFFILVFGYGCAIPFEAGFCRVGAIEQFSFWDEYIDDVFFYDTCNYVYTDKGVGFINKSRNENLIGSVASKFPVTYETLPTEPVGNARAQLWSFLTFLLLWLSRWVISGKHFWQRP